MQHRILGLFILSVILKFNLFGQIIASPFQASNHALKYANAIEFDGINDYINVSRPIGDNFTIEYWIKTTQVGTSGGMWYHGVGIVDAEVGGGTNDFGTSLNGSKLSFGIGNPDYTITSNSSINDGTWKHIAVTRTKSTGAVAIYINGALDKSGTCSNYGTLTAPGYLRLGGMQTAVNYFDGALDDIRIWNVVRSQAEIAANMNQELNGDETGLVAYFKCNQGIPYANNTGITTLYDETTNYHTSLTNFSLTSSNSNFIYGKLNTNIITEGLLLYVDPAMKRSYNSTGNILADLSLNANNGTLSTSAPVFNTAPKRFTFNGTSSNFISFVSSKFNTPYTGKTVMVAAKMDPNFGTNQFRALFGSTGVSRNFNFYMYHNGTNYVLHFSAGGYGTFSDPLAITTGQWVVLAATQDLNTTTYYLNGIKIGMTSMPLTQYGTSTDENIGKSDNFWYGDIGPVLIYKRCLSETEIVQNYNAIKKNIP